MGAVLSSARPAFALVNKCMGCVLYTVGTVLDNQGLRDKLSMAEQKFTTEFFVAMGRHLKGSVLDKLPPAYQSLVSAVMLLWLCRPAAGAHIHGGQCWHVTGRARPHCWACMTQARPAGATLC
jgi:hypothetical protein